MIRRNKSDVDVVRPKFYIGRCWDRTVGIFMSRVIVLYFLGMLMVELRVTCRIIKDEKMSWFYRYTHRS